MAKKEYIERETAITEIDKGDLLVGDNAKWAKEILYRTPTADVVEVKHGEWLPGHYEGGIFDGLNFDKCSECQYERLIDDVKFKTHFKYCPICGADMRGD